MPSRGSQRGFIWIPRPFKVSYRILIDDVDKTRDITASKFGRKVTEGVGKFELSLINTDGTYNSLYSGGEEVKLYITYDGTETLRYLGLIDVVEQKFNKYYSTTIKGSHYSEKLLDITITASFDDEQISGESSSIVNTIIADANTELSETFTTTNITTNTTTATINWSQKPFLECMKDICNIAGYDFYVDDDKDCHFFEENSVENADEAIVWNDNLIKIEGLGTDTKDVRNKVTVYGEDENQIPIIYTAESSSSQSSYNVKVKDIKDTDISTMAEAKERADAELSLLSATKEKGEAKCLLMYGLKPGDYIWATNPTQGIHGQYKVYEYEHEFPKFMTKVILKTVEHIPMLFKTRIQKELALESILNENKLKFSYNEDFSSDTGSGTNTTISNGLLSLITSPGTWTSDAYSATDNITEVELRVVGQDLGVSFFNISVNGGTDFEPGSSTPPISGLTKEVVHETTHTGSSLKVQIYLVSDTANPDPRVDSIAILYT